MVKKMNYLEIIELRSSSKNYKILSEKLTNFTIDLNKEYENYSIRLYRHLKVETDWSIHVQYHSKGLTTSPSPVGLRIASALKEFGLVHYSVWSEEKGGENKNYNT